MRNRVAKNSIDVLLFIVLGLAVSSRPTMAAAAPAADQAMLAADRAFTQAVARGNVRAVAIVLDRDAAWTTADGTTFNASQVGQGMPKPAISDEARAEATATLPPASSTLEPPSS
jgi:hypothetical protein